MEVVIEGLDSLTKAFDKAGVDLPGQFHRAMVASVNTVKQTAQEIVPVRTSALRTSIFEKVSNPPLVGQVGVGQPYGKYVEFGTRPHTIVPVSAKVLAFTVGGSLVFATKVNHPGSAARPFMQPSLARNLPKIRSYFARAAQDVLNKIARFI